MRHLVTSGAWIATVCGAAKNIDDSYAHVGAWLDNPDLSHVCPDCLEVWDSVAEDEETP